MAEIRMIDRSEWLRRWAGLPESCREIYWHPGYYEVNARWEGGEAACLLAEEGGRWCLSPFIRREIKGYDNVVGIGRTDVSTAYGYGGPVFVGEWDEAEKRDALRELGKWLSAKGTVAEFVRCHPAWCDPGLLSQVGYETRTVRTNVECDLKAGHLDRTTGSWAPVALRNLRRAGNAGLRYAVSDRPSPDTLTEFERLYRMTADRLDMAPFYRFDHEYFEGIFGIDPTLCRLVLVYSPDEGQAIAGAIMFVGGRVAYYHLGASDHHFWNLRCNELLYAAMAEVAKEANCERISWGGGLTNDPSDTLFRFKSRFGQIRVPVVVAFRALDIEAYEALCEEWSRRNPEGSSSIKLFLRYRT